MFSSLGAKDLLEEFDTSCFVYGTHQRRYRGWYGLH